MGCVRANLEAILGQPPCEPSTQATALHPAQGSLHSGWPMATANNLWSKPKMSLLQRWFQLWPSPSTSGWTAEWAMPAGSHCHCQLTYGQSQDVLHKGGACRRPPPPMPRAASFGLLWHCCFRPSSDHIHAQFVCPVGKGGCSLPW